MTRENNIKILSPAIRFKSAPDVDLSLDVPFSQNSKNITEYDRSRVIDLIDVFDNEREKSILFRPLAKITFLFKNTYVGETNYRPYYENLYYVNAAASSRQFCDTGNPNIYWSGYPLYNEFDLTRTDNDTPGYTEPNTSGHINFVSTSASSYNWNFFISYPYDNVQRAMTAVEPVTGQNLIWNSANGIPFIIYDSSYNGQSLISFRSVCKHGLSVGEFVELSPLSYDGQNVFQISNLGDGTYGSENFIFSIPNFGYTGNTFLPNTKGTAKRVLDDNNVAATRSEYYVRRNKIISKNSDAVLTNAGFELNPFKVVKQYEPSATTPNYISRVSVKEGSQSYNLSFLENITTENLVDNQKRPLSELYFTFQWIGFLGWTSKPTFGTKALKQGWEFNLPTYQGKPSPWWTNNPQQLNTNSYTSIQTSSYSKPGTPQRNFYYNNPLTVGDVIDGDFCEWNNSEYQERVISPIYHKITYNENVFDINITGESEEENPLGYYYQVHHPLKIRAFSSYIEEGTPDKVSEIPDWAAYDESIQSFIWRDIYPYGFVDSDGIGVDYPFLNGSHYPFRNLIFRLIPEGSTSISLTSVVALPDIDECE